MTRTSRRRLRACAAAGLAAFVLTGCGGQPLRAGAAALIGTDRISDGQLEQVVSRGLADPQAQQSVGQDRANYQRQSLSRLIQHRLLEEAARRQGVTVSERQVDQQLAIYAQQAGGLDQLEQQGVQNGIAKQDLRGFVRDVVLTQQFADRLTADIPVPDATLRQLYAKGSAMYDQVHTQHILVRTAALAQSLLKQVKANPRSFAALAAKNSIDTSNKDKGGDLGLVGRGSFVKEFDQAVFAAKQGDYLVVRTQFGFHVVHVLERRTITLAQATPELRRQALSMQRKQKVQEMLRGTAQKLGVTVNPRFGRWDPAAGSVVATPVGPGSVSSPQPTPGGGGGGPAGPDGGTAPVPPAGGQNPGGQNPGGQPPTP